MNQTTVLVTGAALATELRSLGRNEDAKSGFLGSISAKRAATVEEIADAIVFIASAKVPYLAGQSIAVGGGCTAQ